METSSSLLKSVVLAANQYIGNPVERNLVHLQRQLDVLISKTSRGCSLKFFHPSEVLPAECLTMLVQIIGDPTTKQPLLLKCILLFHNLVSDYDLRRCLHDSFQITPALSSVIKYNMSSATTIVSEALTLLQKVTYGHRISFQEVYMEDLVKFLFTQVTFPSTGLTAAAMGTLVNLTRGNFSVQSYVKSNMDTKELSRSLTKLLGEQSHHILLFSLSLLFTLCLHEKLGNEFFNNKTIYKTYQLLFNLVVDGDTGDTRRYTVDLFNDLLKVAQFKSALTKFTYLGSCVEQILPLLNSSSAESVAKIFELLLIFCRADSVKLVVCKSIVSSFPLQDASVFPNLSQLPLSQVTDPLLSVFHWAGQSTDTQSRAPLVAFDLLIEVYEELVFSHDRLHHDKHASVILPIILQTLKSPLEGDNSSMQKKCEKMVKAIKLLLVLCNNDNLALLLEKEVQTGLLSNIIQFQFEKNTVMMKSHVQTDESDWSQRGVDLVLCTLELVSQLKGRDMENLFLTTLQDSRMVPFLAMGLSSTQRERVQAAMSIVCKGATVETFPTIILGDTLATRNADNQEKQVAPELGLSGRGPSNSHVTYTCRSCLSDNKENTRPHSRDVTVSNRDTILRETTANLSSVTSGFGEGDASIQSLIDKMNTGLDMKDTRASEIISVYERALKSQQNKEQNLQDLLEAKTMALTQADRMLAQYRSRKGADEAESNRLRSLLLDYERKSDQMQRQLEEKVMRLEKLNKEIDELDTENVKLEEVARIHKQLNSAHTELSEKHENLQKSHLTLQQEHQSLTEIHGMLEKHNTHLRQQHDEAMIQLTNLTEEKKKTTKHLKDLETKYEDMKKASLKWEYEFKRSEEERESLDKAIELLRSEIAKGEAKKKQLKAEVEKLEFLCNQNEMKIGELEKEIQDQRKENDKHRQIAALINSLSSGKDASSNSHE